MTDLHGHPFPFHRIPQKSALWNYLGPDRHYHDFFHVGNMLNGRRKYYPDVEDPEVMDFAILYHDVEYDPTSSLNEEDSADIAVLELESALPADRAMEVHRLIIITKHHRPVPGDHAGAVITDLDLAGLAGSNYLDNSRAIRKEYHMATDEQWRAGRVTWLESFLSRPKIYHTEYGRANWEIKARVNMRNELAYLRGLV
jgi:predicted metal-dependent HD superfamily phosphohydrolase